MWIVVIWPRDNLKGNVLGPFDSENKAKAFLRRVYPEFVCTPGAFWITELKPPIKEET